MASEGLQDADTHDHHTRVRSIAVRNDPRKGTAGEATPPSDTCSKILLYMPFPGSAKGTMSLSKVARSSGSALRAASHVFFRRDT